MDHYYLEDSKFLQSPPALAAFFFLFITGILVSNVILVIVVIGGGLVKQRSFLILLNFAAADVIYAICLFVQTLRLLVQMELSPRGLMVLYIIDDLFLPSVVQTTLVLVNVSYVLETRKEHARLNGSRLLAAVMVASPWLYALLVVTPFAGSAGSRVEIVNIWTALLVVPKIIPGFFACIAATLAVVSYVTRDRQEVNDSVNLAGEATPMDSFPSPQSGSDFDDLLESTSPADAPAATVDDVMAMPPAVTLDDDTALPPPSTLDDVTALPPPSTLDDVTAEVRFPRAEFVYTTVSVGLTQVTMYFSPGLLFKLVALGVAYEICEIAAFFINCLRPAFFVWLWLLRPDYKKAFNAIRRCGCRSGAYSNF